MTAYSPTAWVNNTTPALNATNLNHLTDELKAQAAAQSIVHTLPTWANGVTPAVSDAAPLNEMERVAKAVQVALGIANYTVTAWSANWTPARNAVNLNHLEAQVQANRTAIDAPPPPATSIYWGARIDGAYYFTAPTAGDPNIYWVSEGASANNIDAPFSGSEIAGASWDRFESHVGKEVTLILWGDGGDLSLAFSPGVATRCDTRGALNLYTRGSTTQQVLDLAANTNVRSAITQATTLATAMKNWGKPLFFRPWWEMNGNWGYAWQTGAGVSAATYVAAWRNFRTIFDGVGATNVTWCWTPNTNAGGVPDPTPWYPGDAYVDWLGLDAYNHGSQTVASLFDPIYAVLAALNATKPMIVTELASTETGTPTKAAWISDLYGTRLQANYPRIKAICWFNETGNPVDAQIETSTASRNAFAAAIASSYFRSTLPALPFGKVPIP